MSPTDATRGATGLTAAPRRVFLSHTSDPGKPDEPGSFAAAAVTAVLRARRAVTDMAYFAGWGTKGSSRCPNSLRWRTRCGRAGTGGFSTSDPQ